MDIRKEAAYLRESGFPVGIADMSGEPPAKFPTGVSGWSTKLPAINKWPRTYEKEGVFYTTGEIEVIDVDSKHWKEDGDFALIFDESIKGLHFYHKLICYQTMSGGRQYPYYCSKVEGNRKLATRLAGKEAVLETRGKGGLAICPPTEGYQWIDGGEWEAIPTLTEAERDELIEQCQEWNQSISEDIDLSEAKTYKQNSGRPGDDWAAKNDFIAFIKSHGWAVDKVVDGTVLLRRPGKERGCSASWNYKGLGRLFVWSSSVGLPTESLLKPFAVKAHLEYDGDFKACAMALRDQGYGNDALMLVEACTNAKNWGEVGLILQENKGSLEKANFTELSLGLQAMEIKGVTENKLKSLKNEFVSVEKVTWEDELTYDDDDKVKGKIYNVDLILNNDPAYKDVFFYDDFAQKIVINNKKEGQIVDFDDEYMARIRVVLGRKYGAFRPEDIEAVVLTIAKRNHIHPLRERIKSVEWDGVKRIDTWLSRYCEVEDSAYSRIIGPRWLIGAIARLFRPGCKLDNMLILEGEQGDKKSTVLRLLSYDNFLDGILDIRSKDGLMGLFGKWIIEFSELEGMNGRTVEQIKAFLVKQEDRIRRPYAKKEELFKRTCLFAGTTNKNHYLEDDANRRFWPVKAGRCDIKAIEEDRDQIWAEAYQAFRNGVQWWVDEESDEANILRGEQSSRVDHDEFSESIVDYATEHVLDDGSLFVKISDIWKYVYFGKTDKLDRRKQREIAGSLRKLGFKKADFSVKGVRFVGWRKGGEVK